MVGQTHHPVLNMKMLDKNLIFFFFLREREGWYQAQNKGKSSVIINEDKKIKPEFQSVAEAIMTTRILVLGLGLRG